MQVYDSESTRQDTLTERKFLGSRERKGRGAKGPGS